jgi:drug/metabolite transporter (DMT)-like permease
VLVGLGCALGAALLYGAAAVGQAVASRRLPPPGDGLVGLTVAALRDRLMLAVIASYLVGAALHLAAIELTPLYLAQAAIAASLPVTALVAAVTIREGLTPLDWAAILATGVGIALLAVGAGDAGSGDHDPSFVVALYVGLALVVVLGLAAYRASGPWSGATLGLLGGVAYSGTTLAARALHGDGTLRTGALVVVLCVFGVLGFWLYSFALQRVSVTGATAPLILAETVVPAAVGIALLGDTVPSGSWPLLTVALVLAMGGAVWLSGFEGRVQGRVATDARS